MEVDRSTSSGSVSNMAAQPESIRAKNDAKWEVIREHIHRIYVEENNTLSTTRDIIYREYSFKAGTRKWKDKLKEWKFDKNLSISDMNIVVAKQQKRAREGKDTVFMHGSIEMTSERIETFKRRKITKVTDAVSPSAETPENVTYHTPGPCSDGVEDVAHHGTFYHGTDESEQVLSDKLSEQFAGFKFDFHADVDGTNIAEQTAGSVIGSEEPTSSPSQPVTAAESGGLQHDQPDQPVQLSTGQYEATFAASEYSSEGNSESDYIITYVSEVTSELVTHDPELHPFELRLILKYLYFCCDLGIRVSQKKAKALRELDVNDHADFDLAYSQLMSGSLRRRIFHTLSCTYGVVQLVAFLISHAKHFTPSHDRFLASNEAEAIFRTINNTASNSQLRALCCYHLATLLRNTTSARSEEIPKLLWSVIVTRIQTPGFLEGDCECTLLDAILDLREFYEGVDLSLWPHILYALDNLHRWIMMENPELPKRTRCSYRFSFQTRYSIPTLAGLLSSMLEFSIADIMLPALERSDPLCVFTHLQRSMNYQRQDELDKSFYELEAASLALYAGLDIAFKRSLLSASTICDHIHSIRKILRAIRNGNIKFSIKIKMERELDALLFAQTNKSEDLVEREFPPRIPLRDAPYRTSQRPNLHHLDIPFEYSLLPAMTISSASHKTNDLEIWPEDAEQEASSSHLSMERGRTQRSMISRLPRAIASTLTLKEKNSVHALLAMSIRTTSSDNSSVLFGVTYSNSSITRLSDSSFF